jgi:hypothetical protein
VQEQQELQLARQQLEAECRTAKQQLAEAQTAAAAARVAADATHDNLRSIMLQLKLAAQSLADVHKDQEQQQQQQQQQEGSGAAADGQQLLPWQLSRVQQLYLQIVHELAVLPKLEEQPAASLSSSVPVMLRLPRLMARVVLTEQQLHHEQQVRDWLGSCSEGMLLQCGTGGRRRRDACGGCDYCGVAALLTCVCCRLHCQSRLL